MESIVVTGCSSGIGREAALHFSKDFKVYAGAPSLADFDAEITANKNIFPVEIDFLKPETIDMSYKIISSDLDEDGLYGLINNAGSVVAGPLEYMNEADFRRLMEINFWGHVKMIQTFLPSIRRTNGRIINVSSALGRVAAPFHGPYAASKFAYEAYSDALRMELKICSQIKVIIINPGSTKTNVWRFLDTDFNRFLTTMSPEAISRYIHGFQKFHDTFKRFEEHSIAPRHVVKSMVHALLSKNPKTHYYPGLESRVYNLVRLIPDKIRDQVSFKVIGLK